MSHGKELEAQGSVAVRDAPGASRAAGQPQRQRRRSRSGGEAPAAWRRGQGRRPAALARRRWQCAHEAHAAPSCGTPTRAGRTLTSPCAREWPPRLRGAGRAECLGGEVQVGHVRVCAPRRDACAPRALWPSVRLPQPGAHLPWRRAPMATPSAGQAARLDDAASASSSAAVVRLLTPQHQLSAWPGAARGRHSPWWAFALAPTF